MPLVPYLQPALLGLLATRAAAASWLNYLQLATRAWRAPDTRANIVPFPLKTAAINHSDRPFGGGQLLPFKYVAAIRNR